MGVCGCGKSTVGQALSAALGLGFLDADTFHPPSNVQKMARGQPLTDEDRAPWLAAIAQRMREEHSAGRRCIFSCSALKRAYRDVLRAAVPAEQPLLCVLLSADSAVLSARLAARTGHFMNPALLESQLATLEAPVDEPCTLTLDVAARSVPELVAALTGLFSGS